MTGALLYYIVTIYDFVTLKDEILPELCERTIVLQYNKPVYWLYHHTLYAEEESWLLTK